MKNILLATNIILIALVGYLYFLHFHTEKNTTSHFSTVRDTASGAKARVAYIDLDSLQSNYGYYIKIKAESDRRQQAATNEISGLQDAAVKEIGRMQQDLQEKKQKLDNELYDYTAKVKDDMLKRIQNFLKDYNKDNKYDYVFSFEPGFMFYKDTTLNITHDVIEGLNDLYAKEKK